VISPDATTELVAVPAVSVLLPPPQPASNKADNRAGDDFRAIFRNFMICLHQVKFDNWENSPKIKLCQTKDVMNVMNLT
jgi:hypothetical protein